jgi:hypothetical protein
MEETPENGKESSHSTHANGMNEWMKVKFCTLVYRKNKTDIIIKDRVIYLLEYKLMQNETNTVVT